MNRTRSSWELGRLLLLELAACAASGVIIYYLWANLGLPDLAPDEYFSGQGARPARLRLFASLFLPASFGLPSLALAGLGWLMPNHLRGRGILSKSLKLDAATFLLLPVTILIPLLGSHLGDWFLAMGICILGMSLFKGCILLDLLWKAFLRPEARPDGRLSVRARAAVVLALSVPLILASAWVDQSVSAAGDETGYLLLANSLGFHGSTNLETTVQNEEYKRFYWGRWSGDLAMSIDRIQSRLYPLAAAPFFRLMSRPGLLFFQAALLAFLALLVFVWLEGAGIRAGPAAVSVGLCLFSAPVLMLSQMAYPDTLGMVAMALGLNWIRSLKKRPLAVMAALSAVALFLLLLKVRLFPLGAGLLLAGAVQLAAMRWGTAKVLPALLGLAAAALALAVFLPAEYWPASLWQHRHLVELWLVREPGWATGLGVFFKGVLLDQTFGILPVAPVFLLAIAGLGLGVRLFPARAAQVLIPAAIYIGLLAVLRWFQWYGGFASPGRYLAMCLPFAALFMAPVVQAFSRPGWRMLVAVPALLSLGYSWLLCLLPALRFSRVQGTNPVVAKLESLLGLDLFHLLPSTLGYSPLFNWWLAAALISALALGWLAWRLYPRTALADRSAAPDAVTGLGSALAVGVMAALFLMAASHLPSKVREAETMDFKGGALFAEYARPDTWRGVSLLHGGFVEGSFYFPGGEARLGVKAYNETPGTLVAYVDGRRAGETSFTHRGAPAFIELGRVNRGRHLVRLELDSCLERKCFMLIDRVDLLY